MQSGWCVSCGGRRGVDGRCPRCDPWWTSPLLVTGVPVVAFFGLLTALVVARFAPKPGAATAARPIAAKPWTPVAGAPMAGPTSAPATASAREESSDVEHPTVAAPPPAITPGPNDLIFRDPDEERRVLVGLEELRATVHEVEAFSRRRGTEVAAPLGEGPKQAETGS